MIGELENALIHYSHAAKLSKSESKKYPAEFNAKQIREYLDCIKHENEDIIILYQKLCQISHPSSISLLPYIFENEKGIVLHNGFDDQLFIEKILSSYKDIIITTFSRPTILSLISLKLINMLDYRELSICEKELSFLDDTGIMERYLEKIQSSNTMAQ